MCILTKRARSFIMEAIKRMPCGKVMDAFSSVLPLKLDLPDGWTGRLAVAGNVDSLSIALIVTGGAGRRRARRKRQTRYGY
ncbi:MAG: hypothetical protein LBO04_05845 [Spirochaetaceae bacterium]|jgi:hypothetical protein|nr:hypothetical protein [Spirochaetaceae bacterium]